MAEPTREEIDTKLALAEARTETRFVELNGKLDRIVDSIGGLAKEIGTVKADNRFTRLTIVVAVIGSVIAGIAALWVTQANLLSAFQTGLSLRSEQTQATTFKASCARPSARRKKNLQNSGDP